MPRYAHRLPRWSLCLVVGLAACGCGPDKDKGVIVKGKLVQNKQPYKGGPPAGVQVPPGEGVGHARVVFIPVESEDESLWDPGTQDLKMTGKDQYAAIVKDDGTFELVGHKGKGIPPGKYRIVIKHIDPSTTKDWLKDAFNEVNSKITRDVKEGMGEIVIDVGKPPKG